MGVGQGGRDQGEKGYVSNLGWHGDREKAEQLCAGWSPGSLKAGNWSGTLGWGGDTSSSPPPLATKGFSVSGGSIGLDKEGGKGA